MEVTGREHFSTTEGPVRPFHCQGVFISFLGCKDPFSPGHWRWGGVCEEDTRVAVKVKRSRKFPGAETFILASPDGNPAFIILAAGE